MQHPTKRKLANQTECGFQLADVSLNFWTFFSSSKKMSPVFSPQILLVALPRCGAKLNVYINQKVSLWSPLDSKHLRPISGTTLFDPFHRRGSWHGFQNTSFACLTEKYPLVSSFSIRTIHVYTQTFLLHLVFCHHILKYQMTLQYMEHQTPERPLQ